MGLAYARHVETVNLTIGHRTGGLVYVLLQVAALTIKR